MRATHEEAARMYTSGQSLSQVSAALGVSIGFVRVALKKTGTPARERGCGIGIVPKRDTRKGVPQLAKRLFDFDAAAALYRQGKSLNEIAALMGVGDEAVRRALRSMGVEMRARGAQAGTENHQFKGGTRKRKDGYVITLGSRAKQMEHRAIAERVLGRPLTRNEVVHHINCNKQDNRPENLLICTHEYHMALHARMRRDPYWREIERTGRALSKPQQPKEDN